MPRRAPAGTDGCGFGEFADGQRDRVRSLPSDPPTAPGTSPWTRASADV